jgi:REP element-mobilizing transposase RayT
MSRYPLAYLITCRTYGTWFHGDSRGSVDPDENTFGSPLLPAQPALVAFEKSRLREAAYVMATEERECVLRTLVKTCNYRSWSLLVAHVRATHFHVVVQASADPNEILRTLKSRATIDLKKHGGSKRERFWVRGGSKRYLWEPSAVYEAVEYVIDGQGKPMSVFQLSW